MFKTKPEEFKKFHKALMSNAPKGYRPWYFPVVENNKAPDSLYIGTRAYPGSSDKYSWKSKHALLSFERALERLKNGGNIGLSARSDDPLVIIDIDEYEYGKYLLPSLINKSRKRLGWHCFCWTNDKKCKINVPTDFGEIRSADQYVVCAGSFCTTSKKDIDKENVSDELKKEVKNDSLLGVYTCQDDISPLWIKYEDLPLFFRERNELVEKREREKPKLKKGVVKSNGNQSALFNLSINDIISVAPGKREPHPLHSSDTGMNFSIRGGLAHCWRHLVSLNPIQFLCVKAGYLSCEDAGSSHKGGGAGSSMVIGDDGAIFYAWLEAKKLGIIPRDDPIPSRAMNYIAVKYGLVPFGFEGLLPVSVYNKVIRIVERAY